MTDHHEHDSPAGEWDSRYADEHQLWSGHVNGSLVAEVEDLAPGRALDIGCGEGADALWLAEHGWTVTGTDISAVAIERARAEAERRGLDVRWTIGDFPADCPDGDYELVALHYPALPITTLDTVVAALTDAVTPGGVLLVVGHAIPAELHDLPFDPADYVQPADVEPRLGPAWTIDVSEVRARPGDHHEGAHHQEDVILRARRTG